MPEFFLDTLANGLRLLTVEMPHLHSVELSCSLGIGSSHEEPQLAGISHFLEHMLFRGSQDYPSSQDLESRFEAIGGNINAATDAESTYYHSRLHPDHVGDGLQLMASMLQRPLLSDIDTERKIILEEAQEDLNQEGQVISPDLLMNSLLWPEHPLSQPTIGTVESITAIDTTALRSFHQRYYTPANTVIALAGRIDRKSALAAATEAFGAWSGPVVESTPPPPIPPVAGQTSRWVTDADSQLNLQLAFRIPGRHHSDTPALRMLRRILSGGGTTRLMQRLRENLGLTYNAEAHLSLFNECGSFAVDLAVTPENLLPAITELLLIFEELTQEQVGDGELAKVLSNYLFELEFSHDHADLLSARYGWGLTTGFLRSLEDERLESSALRPEQMLSAAQTHFTAANLHLVVVGPYNEDDRKQVEQRLAAYGG
jgi:predicted Zn-dependent peptidase